MNHAVNRTAMTEYIKVNFPLTEEDYKTGNGEGMWVLVDHETKRAHDEDAMGGRYYGILDNDSLYYPGLEAGTVFPFEMRGENRPVADYHGFLEQLTKLTPEGKNLLFLHIQAEAICEPEDDGPLCGKCQYCGDKYSFPEPNDLLEADPENPLLKHFYCCCGDCERYGKDITNLGIYECKHFDEL